MIKLCYSEDKRKSSYRTPMVFLLKWDLIVCVFYYLHMKLLEILCLQKQVHSLLVLETIIPNINQLILGKNKVLY